MAFYFQNHSIQVLDLQSFEVFLMGNLGLNFIQTFTSVLQKRKKDALIDIDPTHDFVVKNCIQIPDVFD